MLPPLQDQRYLGNIPLGMENGIKETQEPWLCLYDNSQALISTKAISK